MCVCCTNLFHNRQDPGLVVIIPISANTQIDLLLKCICLVCSGQLEDAVWSVIFVSAYASKIKPRVDLPIGRGEGHLLPNFCMFH